MSHRNDYDSPWKTIAEHHFEDCLAFYFPKLHAAIDWQIVPRFLEQELQQISWESEVGLRRVDKLVEVQLKDGLNLWLLLHIEIQHKRDDNFAERMFVYHYRIFERFHRHPVSLAILTDRAKAWHPKLYEWSQFNCTLRLDFPAVKLLDYEDEAMLLASPNPFALVTLAQLAENKAGKREERRYATKLRLIRLLLKHGYSPEAIRNLLIFIDWILKLPKVLEQELQLALADPSKRTIMRYITSWEEMAEERGLEKGLKLAVRTILESRFGELPATLIDKIETLNEAQLREALQFVSVVKSLDAMAELLTTSLES